MSREGKQAFAEMAVFVGLLIQHVLPAIVIWVIAGTDLSLKAAIALCWFGASLVTIWACWLLMESKGWSGLWGLFGIAGLAGVVVLACLPDQHAEGRAFEVIPRKPPPEEYD